MKVTVAKSAGFCFGVKRAVEMVYEEAEKGHTVYTLGPIIHNEQVVEDLEKKGVQVIHSVEELAEDTQATVIIRSHGVTRQVYQALEQKKVHIVDATCPFVKKIHQIVQEKQEQNYQIVVVGNASHPEVEGICGWCDNECTVVETIEEAKNCTLDTERKVCVVAQTTFNYKKFQDIVDILSKKSYDILVMNTICNATEVRQTEAGTIARQSDAMIVIGGKHSSNTQKLFEICKSECQNTHFIQTLDDLDLKLFESFRSVGITAGASTPNNIIKEVQSYVRHEQ
ncbi:MAG: 4-hydroxy-3-methylbut-2-enyl diphosphate reductase [Butyribacter sp.]|nr:4-hydroxy-3-methylbut-2-enyl diphosphate reductase [bacterium]MDY3855189.1 4-hydroxy-3-methylbut-2-enyl diphosphate reductase [Butyribacter sp.]